VLHSVATLPWPGRPREILIDSPFTRATIC
jgi:hypothetical protein